MTPSNSKQQIHLCSMQPYSTPMVDTCMTYSCISRKVCVHTDICHRSSNFAMCEQSKQPYLLHVQSGAGDKLVLLADVDKHSATDLVKLLNR